MIDHCPKCGSTALDHNEASTGTHDYTCAVCDYVSRTIEVPEETLRHLTLGTLQGLRQPAVAQSQRVDGA